VDRLGTDSGPVLEVVRDVPPNKIGSPEGSDVETHGADDVTVLSPSRCEFDTSPPTLSRFDASSG